MSRRGSSFGHARRDGARFMGERAAAGGGAPVFSPADIPSQLLRIDAAAGFTLSGTNITAIADQSSAGETITITGAPQYMASTSGLNNEPSFTVSGGTSVIAPNVNRASIRFTAVVAYMGSTASFYLWDADENSNRHYAKRESGNLNLSGTTHAVAGEPSIGRKRILAPNDGTTQTLFNGTALTTPFATGTASGSGVIVGCAFNLSSAGARIAFYMLCSAVPSSGDRALLEAYLATRFG